MTAEREPVIHHVCGNDCSAPATDREGLIKAAEARYVGSSLPWLWSRERRGIAAGVDAVLAALSAEPEQEGREGLQAALLDVFERHGVSVGVGLTKTGVVIRSQDERVDASNLGAVQALAEPVRATDPVRAALVELVSLKDGPRDEHYRQSKDAAWDRARAALAADREPVEIECPLCFEKSLVGPPGWKALAADRQTIPLEQHKRAIMNVMQLDILRRSELERSELKQQLRDLQRRYDELSATVVSPPNKATMVYLRLNNFQGEALVKLVMKAPTIRFHARADPQDDNNAIVTIERPTGIERLTLNFQGDPV